MPAPNSPQNVNATVPKVRSETSVRTMVRRLPTDVTMGPQIPNNICQMIHLKSETEGQVRLAYHNSGIEHYP